MNGYESQWPNVMVMMQWCKWDASYLTDRPGHYGPNTLSYD